MIFFGSGFPGKIMPMSAIAGAVASVIPHSG